MHKVKYSCRDWDQGEFDEIDNDYKENGLCKVREPEYCWYNTFDGYLDVSKLTSKCKNRNNKYDPSMYKKYFENFFEDAKFMAYPNVNDFSDYNLLTNING